MFGVWGEDMPRWSVRERALSSGHHPDHAPGAERVMLGSTAMARAADTIVGRSAELAAIDGALAELERRRFVALELAGEPGIGKTRAARGARRPRRRGRVARALGPRRGARARPAVLDVRGRARRLRARASSRAAWRSWPRTSGRARARAAVAARARRRAAARPSLPHAPRGAAAARAARRDQAARARARRRPLGRLRLDRAARRAAAPPARRAGADRRRGAAAAASRAAPAALGAGAPHRRT